MAGCIAGSLRPSLAPGGLGSRRPIPGLLGRVGCCFQTTGPGQPMLCHREVDPIPSSCLSFPSCSTTALCQQLWVVGGYFRDTRPWDSVVPGEGSPCSHCFFPPLPAKPGCSHFRELDHQQGWMEAGLPQYGGKLGAGGVWLCPPWCHRLHTQYLPLCCLPRNTPTSPRSP